MNAIEVRRFFERVAPEWDAMRSEWYDERVITELAQRARVTSSSTVLDVGTGTGFVACGLASRAGHVIGVDNAPAMLGVARRNLDGLGLRNVELGEAEVGRLPLSDGSVDASVANMVLHHAIDPDAMIREMVRVTRPGGYIAITDEVAHPFAWMRDEHADVWLGFERAKVESIFRNAGLVRCGYASIGLR